MAKEFTDIDNHILDVIYEYVEVKNVCSKAELAAYLNVARSTVSAWIKRESIPDANKIPGICNKFGITPNFIFGIKDLNELSNEDRLYLEAIHNNQSLKDVIDTFAKKA